MQCHSYIQLQHKECLLAEAQLKEGKGNLHALVHIANSPVCFDRCSASLVVDLQVVGGSGGDSELHQLQKEKERLSRLLAMIDS